jgi:hypothetical protein
MAASTFHPRRRRFIRLAMVGAAMTPLASALTSGSATADELISESDPAALRLKCKADATTAPERTSPTEFCDDCLLYTSKSGASGSRAALGDRSSRRRAGALPGPAEANPMTVAVSPAPRKSPWPCGRASRRLRHRPGDVRRRVSGGACAGCRSPSRGSR